MKSKSLLQLLLYLISLLVSSSANDDNATVEYYVNVINEEIARSLTYELPTDASDFKTNSSKTSIYGTYDYVIVGAGATGAVIASRLSEITKNHVLLLEAGGNETDFSNIPGMSFYLQNLEFNWNYNTTPQKTSCL
ncbi:hypothetical protein ILUMI_18545, partial [Ignelater luminosus]